jgi:hypothetical protein
MGDAVLQQAIAARDKQVSSLLSDPANAVKAALADPPYTATESDTRVRTWHAWPCVPSLCVCLLALYGVVLGPPSTAAHCRRRTCTRDAKLTNGIRRMFGGLSRD